MVGYGRQHIERFTVSFHFPQARAKSFGKQPFPTRFEEGSDKTL
jgi:hypothetical protein